MSSSEDDAFRSERNQKQRKQSVTSSDSDGHIDALDEVQYANCRMTQLPCFHEAISRSKAEILLENTQKGCYLIRDSTIKGNYSISVKSASAVKHFQIVLDEEKYSFGRALFWSPFEIWRHLQEQPILELDEGDKVQFMYPYLNECKVSQTCGQKGNTDYSVIGRHYIPDRILLPQPNPSNRLTLGRKTSSNIVTSIEGQLYKKKKGKTWKCRWCILKEHSFSYKKNEKDYKPIKSLDLRTALQVTDDYEEPARKNCFRIIFPDMYYIFSTNTEEDKQFWLDSIQEQIDENKKGKNGAMNVKTL